MAHTRKFINGGMALILISSSGCAGNGLRNMFSRNETAGYKTLEELEAENAKKESAAESEHETRFASWLPFGKKSTEGAEAEVVAATDPESSESASSGWWKNPFRRQETVEADPFLTGESESETPVAKRADPKTRSQVESVASAGSSTIESPIGDRNVVRTVSKSSDDLEDDALLVDKFEKHFQKNTVDAVDAVESAAPLIVAGKQDASSSKKKVLSHAADLDSSAEDKLQEFERLLAEKKSSARKAKREAVFAEESVTEDFAGEFSDIAENAKATVQKKSESVKSIAENSADNFDSLLAESSPPVSARKPKTSASRTEDFDSIMDVEVSDAAGIFGTSQAKTDKENHTASTPGINGGWSAGSADGDDFGWARAEKQVNPPRPDLARKVMDATVDQFASMFSGSQFPDAVPSARVNDAPESGAWSAVARSSHGSDNGPTGRRSAPIHAASSGRALTNELDKPEGLKEDSYFSTVSASATVRNSGSADEGSQPEMGLDALMAEEAPQAPSETRSGGVSAFRPRNWLMLLGGIIVVALLFAPGRKKPIHATQLPVQG